jgi:hypothetical protein
VGAIVRFYLVSGHLLHPAVRRSGSSHIAYFQGSITASGPGVRCSSAADRTVALPVTHVVDVRWPQRRYEDCCRACAAASRACCVYAAETIIVWLT